MSVLKLLAMDEEDLQIVSAHLQDAVLRVGDMAFLPSSQCFAAMVNRFDWETALSQGRKRRKPRLRRHRTVLRFSRVLSVQSRNIALDNKDAVLELLAVQFEKTDGPGGHVLLTFAGGGTIRLKVECIEAELSDTGAVWRTKSCPQHPLDPEDEETGPSVS